MVMTANMTAVNIHAVSVRVISFLPASVTATTQSGLERPLVSTRLPIHEQMVCHDVYGLHIFFLRAPHRVRTHRLFSSFHLKVKLNQFVQIVTGLKQIINATLLGVTSNILDHVTAEVPKPPCVDGIPHLNALLLVV